MKIAFDLDGTLCEEVPTFEKSMAKPIPGALERVNILHDTGDFIMIYTSRGWSEYKMTEDWLKKHGFRYDLLICGKPLYDVLYDDKAKIPNYLLRERPIEEEKKAPINKGKKLHELYDYERCKQIRKNIRRGQLNRYRKINLLIIGHE